jgi:hypothetical protein
MSTIVEPIGSFGAGEAELTHLREVRQAQQKNLRRSLTYAAMGHLSAITLLLLIALIQRNAPQNERVVTVPYRELQAPPSLQQTPPTVSVAAPTAQPSAGIPLPTEDEQVQRSRPSPRSRSCRSRSAPARRGMAIRSSSRRRPTRCRA